MFDCRDIYELASDYLDREMADADRSAYAGHLDDCPKCSDFYHSFEMTVHTARESVHIEAPPGLAEKLVTSLHELQRRSA